MLADVRYEQGRIDAALELSTKALSLAPGDDLVSQVGWRRARAKALARRGDAAEGERLAREAGALLAASDALDDRATTMVDLAEVLHLASRHDEAEAVEREAFALFQRKGDTAALERSARRLSGLRPARSA